jgi:hypothetical protein
LIDKINIRYFISADSNFVREVDCEARASRAGEGALAFANFQKWA